MEYGSEIWCSGKNISDLETVHLGFLKYTLGVKRSTSSLAIYGETGRFPLVLRQQDNAVKLWFRLKFSKAQKPINHVFSELENLHSLGHLTWLTKIQNILGDFFLNIPNNVSPRRLISQLKDIRYTNFIEKFFADINDSASNPILRTYCLFKSDYRRESYLHHASNRNLLTAISRFRTSSHSLHIETGRHTVPITPKENRICKFCQLNEIDDEIHMLLKCPFHITERTNLLEALQPLFQNYPPDYDEDTFRLIMQIKNPNIINVLGKYLSIGSLRRKKYLESLSENSP